MAPVKAKMKKLEAERSELSSDRGEMEADSWGKLEHLKVTYESLKKSSDTINR